MKRSGAWKASLAAILLSLAVALSACGAPAEASPRASLLQPTPTRPVRVASYTPLPSDTPTITRTPSPTATPDASVTPSPDAIQQTNTAIATYRPPTQPSPAIPPPSSTPAPPTATSTPPDPPVVFYSDRRGQEDIFLLLPDGTVRALTGAASNEREPSCSPDGQTLIYASDASGRFQIVAQRLDSGAAVALTDSEGMNFAPVFSPDGSTIAFVSTRGGGVPAIWLMDADGSRQRPLTSGWGRATSPAWGPDGRQVIYAGQIAAEQADRWRLMLTIVQGEGADLGEFPVLPPEIALGHEVWPVFDPAGVRIAFSAWDDLADPQTANLYLLDFEQPGPLPLRAGDEAEIAWSWLDAARLLVSVGGPGDVRLAALDVASGALTPLTGGGSFNGGARPCPANPAILPPEPPPPPTVTPSPSPTPSPTPGPTSAIPRVRGRPHIVQPGENLLGISYLYDVPLQTLVAVNALPNPDLISVGQRLTIPIPPANASYIYRFSRYQEEDLAQLGLSATSGKKIVVRLGAQEVEVYENGRLLRTLVASTGLPKTPTVQGNFKIYHKLPAQTMAGPDYYLPDVPWVMYFYQGYGLHGTYWHDNFGHPMSHGCINLRTPDARWLYGWAEIGTPVIVRP